MLPRSRILLSLTTLLLLASASASAQGVDTAHGFALDRFTAADPGSDWFSLESLDFRGDFRPAVGVRVDYARKPLVIYNPDGTERTALVSDQGFAHLGLGFGIAGFLRLGVDVPVALGAGKDGAILNTVYPAPQGAGLGDVRVSVLARVAGAAENGFALAVGLLAYAPTGARDRFSGDGYFHVEPDVLLAGNAGAFTYAARVGVHLRGLHTDFDGIPVGNELRGGLALGVRALDHKLLIGPEVQVSRGLTGDATAMQRSTSAEALLGVHYDFGEWRLSAGGGAGLGRGLGTPQVRGVVTIEWLQTLNPTPSSSSGVGEPADPRPVLDFGTPGGSADSVGPSDGSLGGGRQGWDSTPGTPKPRRETQGWDSTPAPSRPEGQTPAPDATPTPRKPQPQTPQKPQGGGKQAWDSTPTPPRPPTAAQPAQSADADGDGIPDSEDACASKPGPRSLEPGFNGCPAAAIDTDGDGIPEAADACPDTPGVHSDDPKKNGCPTSAPAKPAAPAPAPAPAPAEDKGEASDASDKAATDTEETAAKPPAQEAGPLARLAKDEIHVTEQVQFDKGNARILPESEALLSEVSAILRSHPRLKIRVEVHTDDRGDPEKTKRLTKKRAASVVDWLIKRAGISRTRLTSAGLGGEHPIDTNATKAGRANNRRVEFHIVEDGQ